MPIRSVTTRRFVRRRLAELAVLVLFILNTAYSGRHDPDCPHHSIAEVVAGGRAAQAAQHHSRPDGSRGEDPVDDDCRCGTICVAGSTAQSVAPPRPESALLVSHVVGLALAPAHAVFNLRVPYLLPFATAPPRHLSI